MRRRRRTSGAAAGAAGRGAATIAARVHVGVDGTLTVMTGKVECGQGARAELTQAAAEELRVPADRSTCIMADTDLVPDDGGTYGSQTTPNTVPPLRRGCAAARELLADLAARRFGVRRGVIEFRAGRDQVDPADRAARSATPTWRPTPTRRPSFGPPSRPMCN